MKWLYLLLPSLLLSSLPSKVLGQTFNLNYRYTEICSEETRQVSIPIDLKSNNTLAFFGYSRTFTPQEIQNNEPVKWLDDIFRKWSEYYPCAEIAEAVTEASRSSSKSADIDVNKPIVIVSSDLGYKNGGVFKTSGGYNQTNILTQKSQGGLMSFGTNKIGNIGYFSIKPITTDSKSITNLNLIILQNDLIANYTVGIFGSKGKWGSYFFLHALTFGKLNGYPFQDQSLLTGYSNGILNTRRLVLSTNIIFSYTYRLKVFTVDYFWEDYVGISPFLNFGFKVTPTFALNLSYTTSLRTDMNTFDKYSILLGGRVLF